MDYDMTIHHNPDAQAWAKFFIDTTKDMDRDVFRDESYMVVWFSNAMMAMHDHLYVTEIVRRQNEAANEIERLREALRLAGDRSSLPDEAADEIERLRKVLQQITELSPFKFNTGHASLQYITQMLVEMTALAHEALKEKE